MEAIDLEKHQHVPGGLEIADYKIVIIKLWTNEWLLNHICLLWSRSEPLFRRYMHKTLGKAGNDLRDSPKELRFEKWKKKKKSH